MYFGTKLHGFFQSLDIRNGFVPDNVELKQQRPMVFYSADNQIVARDHQRCFVYNPSMSRSFCYDVLPNGNLKETKQESKFQDLKNYVFSNIQAAEYIERHQQ